MSLLFFLTLLSRGVQCLGSKPESSELWNALGLICDVRRCLYTSEHHRVMLPKRIAFIPTSNAAVNEVIERINVAFWQNMRQLDHSRYMRNMVEISKGAALPMKFQIKRAHRRGSYEAQLLKPIFANHSLNRQYRECLLSKTSDIMECVKAVIEKFADDSKAKDIALTAYRFLDIAVDVYTSAIHPLSEQDLIALRSDGALPCIRDWDRNNTIPRIIYLTYLLSARRLIAHLTSNIVEMENVSKVQREFEEIVDTKFPASLIREGRREMIDGSIIHIHQSKRQIRSISELEMFVVKQVSKSNLVPVAFLEETTLYVSISENYGGDDPDAANVLFETFLKEISTETIVMKENPTAIFLQWVYED